MNANYVKLGGEVLIDLRADTAVEEDVLEGRTFHKADGTPAVGTGKGGEGEYYDVSAGYVDGTITDIVVRKGTESIREKAFYYQPITSIQLQDAVKSVGSQAFYHCTKLTGISFPDGGESLDIGKNAFDHCTGMKSILFPSSLESLNIDEYAIYYCSGVDTVRFPDSVQSITMANKAFLSNSNIKTVYIPSIEDWCKADIHDNNTIFPTISGQGPTVYINGVRYQHGAILEIPDGIEEIKANVFKGFVASKIVIPDSVKTIGRNAFISGAYRQSMCVVDLGNGVQTIGDSALIINAIEYIYFPDSVVSIGVSCLQGISLLNHIVIGSGIQTIGDKAFMGSYKSHYVYIKATTPPTIGATTFTADKLLKVIVPYSEDHSILDAYKSATNWSAIADYIVEGQADENEYLFVLNEDETSYSLINCKDWSTLPEIPVSFNNLPVTHIADNSFYDFGGEDITIPEGIKSIGNCAFYECIKAKTITLPDGLQSIGNYAFSGYYSRGGSGGLNSRLTRVTIPDSVQTIGKYAFLYFDPLHTITIGTGILSIGSYAFRKYNSQSAFLTITMRSATPPVINADTFEAKYTNKIIVPYSEDHSILNAYKSATNWSAFADKIEEETPA